MLKVVKAAGTDDIKEMLKCRCGLLIKWLCKIESVQWVIHACKLENRYYIKSNVARVQKLQVNKLLSKHAPEGFFFSRKMFIRALKEIMNKMYEPENTNISWLYLHEVWLSEWLGLWKVKLVFECNKNDV